MAKERISETLWNAIAPLLPEPKPSPKGGRPPVPNRACLEGIIFVLRSGMPWQMLPTELGFGSGSTCWRRSHAWTQLGVWPKLHQRLLGVLGRRGRINLRRAVIDSASMRALSRWPEVFAQRLTPDTEKWLENQATPTRRVCDYL